MYSSSSSSSSSSFSFPSTLSSPPEFVGGIGGVESETPNPPFTSSRLESALEAILETLKLKGRRGRSSSSLEVVIYLLDEDIQEEEEEEEEEEGGKAEEEYDKEDVLNNNPLGEEEEEGDDDDDDAGRWRRRPTAVRVFRDVMVGKVEMMCINISSSSVMEFVIGNFMQGWVNDYD